KEFNEKDKEAIRKHLNGHYNENPFVEIREILDDSHPCRKYDRNISHFRMPAFGLFAKQDIPKKTWILEYVGEVKFQGECDMAIQLSSEKAQSQL
ncbi:hypothetical protein RFI_28890, partial [Reticulomyxa filosa]